MDSYSNNCFIIISSLTIITIPLEIGVVGDTVVALVCEALVGVVTKICKKYFQNQLQLRPNERVFQK